MGAWEEKYIWGEEKVKFWIGGGLLWKLRYKMTGRQLTLEGSREHGDYRCPNGSGSHTENASAYLMGLSSAPPPSREEKEASHMQA